MDVLSIRKKKLITAIKTPYKKKGEIDYEKFNELLQRQIKGGVDGIIVGGTTGEGHLLSWKEHSDLIAYASKKFGSKLLIVGNTGSNNTKECLDATAEGFKNGMHAALLINPYYGKTSKAGLIAHFKDALALGPGIIYNVPNRTAQDIPVSVVVALNELSGNLVGVKECMGNERIAEYYEKGIFCWTGNDEQTFDAYHKFNALGVVSVVANVVPEILSDILNNNNEKLDQELRPLIHWLSSEPNPIPLNSILSDMKLINPVFRRPYLPLPKDNRQEGLLILQKLKKEYVGLVPLDDSDFIII